MTVPFFAGGDLLLKKLLKALLIAAAAVVVLAAALVAFLSITEYRPDDVESVSVSGNAIVSFAPGDSLSVMTWNTGYCGLGRDSDFFMDGGSNVKSADEATVRACLDGIAALSDELGAQLRLYQEVDSDSYRSYGIDEREPLASGACAYALNYSCRFVPFPLPPIGRVNSGLFTVSSGPVAEAERVSLPCPFKWPVSTANLKRCLLISRIPLEGTDRQLVLVNLHLEAYDDGEGKAAQTKMLTSILEREYSGGNYVIAGGDFNQTFPGSLDVYPIKDGESWTPGTLTGNIIPEGWSLAYDLTSPTCRLLNAPYDPDSEKAQVYVIDGFILSPNVRLESVESVDAGFEFSDHNPVLISVTLEK